MPRSGDEPLFPVHIPPGAVSTTFPVATATDVLKLYTKPVDICTLSEAGVFPCKLYFVRIQFF